MKQKDIALIAVVVIFSTVVSFLVCNKFIGNGNSKREKVEIIDPIVAEFKLPSQNNFNSTAFNPTQLIEINVSDNTQPFVSQ